MKKGSGKSKGSAWEREISRFLTKWLTGQQKELYFYRSPGSGAVATINLGNKAISGDIIALKPEAIFLINLFSLELKNGYKDVSLDKHLKYNKADPLKEFWIQCCDDAFKSKKLPMLIYKKKGLPTPWIGIELIFNKHVMSYLKEKRFIHIQWDMNYPDIYFYELKEFFNIITPDIIKNFNPWQ